MHMQKTQRGRPWKSKPPIDRGTHELQHKKLAIVRGDPALSESLLGILYGRRLISQPLYEAGCFFGELGYRFEPCLGYQFRQNASILTHKIMFGKGSNPLSWSEEQDEMRTIAWREAEKALKEAGQEPYRVVLHVVFYDQDLYTLPFAHITRGAYLRPLQRGLACLERYFKGVLKDVQDRRRDQVLSLEKATIFQPS